jgi:hypothetical protein
VLSDGLWRRRFSSDPGIVGRHITLNAESYMVVGVMPPDFFFPVREGELWTPWAMQPDEASGPGDHYVRVMARLKPESRVQQANAEVEANRRAFVE